MIQKHPRYQFISREQRPPSAIPCRVTCDIPCKPTSKHLLLLFLLASTPEARNVATSTLDTLRSTIVIAGCTVSSVFALVDHGVCHAARSSTVGTLVILAAALHAIDTLLGCRVASRLEKTSFTDLAADHVVDAILGFVDLLIASHLGVG